MNQDKMQMFVERYLELSNELKYRKDESGADRWSKWANHITDIIQSIEDQKDHDDKVDAEEEMAQEKEEEAVDEAAAEDEEDQQ